MSFIKKDNWEELAHYISAHRGLPTLIMWSYPEFRYGNSIGEFKVNKYRIPKLGDGKDALKKRLAKESGLHAELMAHMKDNHCEWMVVGYLDKATKPVNLITVKVW